MYMHASTSPATPVIYSIKFLVFNSFECRFSCTQKWSLPLKSACIRACKAVSD